ncbi:winged helix-turn-helix transcriptional regulator [Mucilaginibacter sp. KACC 22063]|uniref:winged helix-turn-helix transcriptional regulator n=1 Tax=Mucilaginibacter sp. KACC 22063 TaxID=3025666 RepID=UPI002365DAC5|nr:helix-turn-helix domain-containing protein [Mucilaginibacter sp. KACC 22063]WDF53474.1 helix-turn-helix domain-containing protein [Mucilaginibacter sp. KACC 22063]
MAAEKNEIKYHGVQECPITATIDVIGGKWKPIIIWLLLEKPVRFGELHKTIDGIALKVLSRQLKELEADGIIIRKAYPEIPPRVEYSLSEKGRSLQKIMQLLSDWSRENILNTTQKSPNN